MLICAPSVGPAACLLFARHNFSGALRACALEHVKQYLTNPRTRHPGERAHVESVELLEDVLELMSQELDQEHAGTKMNLSPERTGLPMNVREGSAVCRNRQIDH